MCLVYCTTVLQVFQNLYNIFYTFDNSSSFLYGGQVYFFTRLRKYDLVKLNLCNLDVITYHTQTVELFTVYTLENVSLSRKSSDKVMLHQPLLAIK